MYPIPAVLFVRKGFFSNLWLSRKKKVSYVINQRALLFRSPFLLIQVDNWAIFVRMTLDVRRGMSIICPFLAMNWSSTSLQAARAYKCTLLTNTDPFTSTYIHTWISIMSRTIPAIAGQKIALLIDKVLHLFLDWTPSARSTSPSQIASFWSHSALRRLRKVKRRGEYCHKDRKVRKESELPLWGNKYERRAKNKSKQEIEAS